MEEELDTKQNKNEYTLWLLDNKSRWYLKLDTFQDEEEALTKANEYYDNPQTLLDKIPKKVKELVIQLDLTIDNNVEDLNIYKRIIKIKR